MYREKRSVDFSFNFGGSSLLARQIQEGASADVFISADEAKIDQLAMRDLIVPGSRTKLLSNRLVVVVASDERRLVQSAEGLLQFRRMALAEPSTVPAGIYARAFLERAGIWEMVAERIVPTENVRGALAAVESGNVDAAIVYQTDAAISRRSKVAWQVPPEQVPEIVYEAALTKDGKNRSEAEAFLGFLGGSTAQELFRKHGFITLGNP